MLPPQLRRVTLGWDDCGASYSNIRVIRAIIEAEFVENLILLVRRRYTMICSPSVHRLFHKLRILVCAALFALLGSANLWAQTRPKILGVGIEHPASAIYIGNSFFFYNNGLSGHVTRLLAAADPQYKFRSTSVTISGSGFDWHDVDPTSDLTPWDRIRSTPRTTSCSTNSTGCLIWLS